MEKTNIAHKYYRLKMSNELRHLLTGIPIKNVQEEHKGDHIYLGVGHILVGTKEHLTTIRVYFSEGGFKARVYSPTSGLDIKHAFNNAKERKELVRMIRKEVRKKLN